MRLIFPALRLLLGFTTLFGAGLALAADPYPVKTVRVLTTETGSANDLMIRLITPGMSAALGQPMIVENRGMVSMELLAKAPPDGYTLLAFGPPLWLLQVLRRRLADTTATALEDDIQAIVRALLRAVALRCPFTLQYCL